MDNFLNDELDDIIKIMQQEKGKPCISIILPLYPISTDKTTNELILKKTIDDLNDHLQLNHSTEFDKLKEQLNSLHQEIKINTCEEGIGIYVSENVQFYTSFPFPVSEKIIIGTQFHLCDLLYKKQYTIPYLFLQLTEQIARLYSGKLKQLEEILDNDFPVVNNNNQYEYQPPSRSTSYAGTTHSKGFERDKNSMGKSRFESFMQQVDERLARHIKGNEKIIVSGVRRNTSAFLNRTIHGEKITSLIDGNYEGYDTNALADLSWKAIEPLVAENMLDEIAELKEKIGEGFTEEGIVPVWDAVAEGRGMTLIVERNLAIQGYLEKQNEYNLHLHAPKYAHIVLTDVINSLIEMMINKNGRVVFVENGMLKDHQHVALITRY